MEEVVALMGKCSGAIILGYPQVWIEKGKIKDQSIPDQNEATFFLATEWNHIEAGLAHAIKLPLLVIHHSGVRRGIFDRGAISNYIYERNLADSSWPLHKDISGAFLKWKSELRDPSKITSILATDFIFEHGVFWKPKGDGVEDIVYCPDCKLAMSAFPPKSDEMLVCSKCNFVAPFSPSQLEVIANGIKLRNR